MAVKNNPENRSTNVWGMIADIAVAAINRGQFLPLCFVRSRRFYRVENAA